MKTQLLKRQVAFISIAIGIFFFPADAQIVYTDVIPDTTITCTGLCSTSYNIDLNNDGVDDFYLSSGLGEFNPCHIYNFTVYDLVKGAGAAVYQSSLYIALKNGYPWARHSGDSINNGLTWVSSGGVLRQAYWLTPCEGSGSGYHGHWNDSLNDYFLPVMLSLSGNSYYGWIRMRVTVGIGGNYAIIVRDYAYNSIPDSSIFAGDPGIPLAISTTSSQNNFLVFPNPAPDKIILTFPSSEEKQIQVTNTLRQVVFAATINSHQEEINIRNFPRGIYIVIVKAASQTFEKKFLKE